MEIPSTMMTSTSTPPPNSIDADAKILSDLSTVQEKITLCESMLVEIQSTTQVDSNESLLTVVGFLEACVPRVRELINVGMTSLKEETLTKCFQVNDDLCKILEDVDHPERVTAVSTTSKAAASSDNNDNNSASVGNLKTPEDLDFDNFGFEDKRQAIGETNTTSAAAASALEDLLAPPSSVVPSSTSSSPKKSDDAKKEDDGDDDFDNFFGEREDKKRNSFSIDE